jgi:hypothetical protein
MASKWVPLRERIKDIWKRLFYRGLKETAGEVIKAYPMAELILEVDGDRVRLEIPKPVLDHIYDLKNLAKGRAMSLRDAEEDLEQAQAILESLVEAVEKETGIDTEPFLNEIKNTVNTKIEKMFEGKPEYL